MNTVQSNMLIKTQNDHLKQLYIALFNNIHLYVIDTCVYKENPIKPTVFL